MSSGVDYPLGQTLHFMFTTRDFDTGAPQTLAGSPVISAYEDGSLTQITAGITLTADFDSVTGLNSVAVVATSGNGYESGKSYHLVITTGTVDTVSVVGEVVGWFTIERSAALRPTTAGRTLDVTSTGAAGIDWANVENPTTALDLSGTDIQLVDTCTTNTDMRGTDNAALASVLGALADAAAAGDPTATDTVIAYVKQLVNVLVGTDGVTTFPAAAAPANAVSLAEVIRAIYDDSNSLDGTKIPDTISLANINAEVDTALATTTYAEPGQETPASTTTLANKIGYLYKFLRNRVTSTSTTISVYNDDATTVAQKSTHSDDGTTYDRGEFTSGP